MHFIALPDNFILTFDLICLRSFDCLNSPRFQNATFSLLSTASIVKSRYLLLNSLSHVLVVSIPYELG